MWSYNRVEAKAGGGESIEWKKDAALTRSDNSTDDRIYATMLIYTMLTHLSLHGSIPDFYLYCLGARACNVSVLLHYFATSVSRVLLGEAVGGAVSLIQIMLR